MDWRSLLWPGITFLLGVLATAGVGAVIERWWKRPRPSVRVLGASLGPKKTDVRVPIDFSLIQRELASPIVDGLKSQMSFKELTDWVPSSKTGLAAHRSIMGHVREMLQRPNLLNPAYSKDAQRKDLLQEWQEFGKALESLGIAALRHFDSETPAKCLQPHPPEWKSGVVHLTAVRDYNLSEIDVDAEVKRQLAREKNEDSEQAVRRHLKAVNEVRRLWIHLEPTDLKWFFARLLDYGQMLEDEAMDIVRTVERLIATEWPEFVRIEVLIANDGDRSLGVWSSASAQVPLPSGPHKAVIPIRLEVAADEARHMEIVTGSQALRLVFYSETPVAPGSIVGAAGATPLTAEQLRALFNAAFQCRVAVAIEGLESSDWTLVASDPFTFGATADQGMQSRLRQLLT